MSTETQSTPHTHSRPDDTRVRVENSNQTTHHGGLWWALSLTEIVTLASSWVALWLTAEVVPAEVGISEANPVADAIMGWSTAALGVFALCVMLTALGLLRLAGARISKRSSGFIISACAGFVAGMSVIDAGWNVLLLTDVGLLDAVGTPGPAAAVFAAGSVAYLCAVHLLSRRRRHDANR